MKRAVIFLASLLFAGGYKIPEQSIKSVALSNAYVAKADGVDSAYYNPANLVDIKNGYQFDILFIHLDKIKFSGDSTCYSREENFAIPTFFYNSKDYNGYRFGFSITYPAGLSKRWDDIIPQMGAKEFTLKTLELNPVIAKKINENFSIAFGLRFVKSEGIANGIGLRVDNNTPLYSQYLNGDSLDRGWNAAIRYKGDFSAAITYRSKVELSLKGDSSGYYLTDLLLAKNPSLPLPAHTYISYNTLGRVKIPIPASLNVAIAKDFDFASVEFVYEKTYWSSYKKLDFNFNDPLVEAVFGTPKPKYWKNSTTYRIGIRKKVKDSEYMLGYAYDNTPIPDSTIDFSLPDSDKHIFSAGVINKINNNFKIGFSALYAYAKKRKASIYNPVLNSNVNGEFSKGDITLFTFGAEYSF